MGLAAAAAEVVVHGVIFVQNTQRKEFQEGYPVVWRQKARFSTADTGFKWTKREETMQMMNGLFCFDVMMFMYVFRNTLQWTNDAIPCNIEKFTEHKHFKMLAILYTTTLFYLSFLAGN